MSDRADGRRSQPRLNTSSPNPPPVSWLVKGWMPDATLAVLTGGGQGVDLISSAESLDTGSAAGRIAINIIDSISQWNRQVIGERTSAILQDLKAQGKSTGNPSYGFEAAEDGTLIENEQEQAVLQYVAELRAQRKSWAKVVNTLTSAGIRTRRGTVFSRQGLSKIAKRAGIQ